MLEIEPVQNSVSSSAPSAVFGVDPVLLAATLQGTDVGLRMTGVGIVPVGTSSLVNARHAVTVMVGLVGTHSGNIALNFSERAALHLASGLMGTTMTEVNEDCVDAIMEIGNMVAGGIKTALADTGYCLQNISLPSLVLGQSYAMA